VVELGSRVSRIARDAGKRPGLLAVGLGSHISPPVSLLHVLLAVGLSLRLVWARLVVALIHRRSRRVLVVVVPIHLFFGGPTILVVLAGGDGALPWARMSLLVLGQVARALKLLVATNLTALLRGKLLRAGVLFAAGHGSHDLLFVLELLASRALNPNIILGNLLNGLDDLASGKRDGLAVLLDANQFSRAAVHMNPAVQLDLISAAESVSGCERDEWDERCIRVNVHLSRRVSLLCVSELSSVVVNLVDEINKVAVGVREIARAGLFAVVEELNGRLDASNRREAEIEVQSRGLGLLL
jgi:hypothetical protein